MEIIQVRADSGNSFVHIGACLNDLELFINTKKTIIISDTNVLSIYGTALPPCPVISISPGECSKNLNTVQGIYEKLIDLEADRSTFIIGIGGGIVCDIAGFAASTYQRGLSFGFVATTLLAQVDASVGGKNGINVRGYKNMAGVFKQPDWVICDTSLLKTLPESELLNGFAEIIKHALIADEFMFDFLEKNYEHALGLDPGILEKLVIDSILIKSGIVQRDETEKGERRKLNFGHTFGHALENTHAVSHGKAVSIGMAVASMLSAEKKGLSFHEMERILAILKNYRLPVNMAIDKDKVADALYKDKKRDSRNIHFVLLNRIGNAVVETIAIDELLSVVERWDKSY